MKRIVSLLLVLACGGSRAHTASVTIPKTSTSIAVPPPASPDWCARIRKDQRAFVRKTIDESKRDRPAAWTPEKETVTMKSVFEGATSLGIACFPFANGAWSLELKALQVEPDYNSGAGELVAVAYVGEARVESEPTMRTGLGGMFTHVDSQLASDYDEDGVPELWMHSEEEGVEGGHFEESRLLHFAKGVVVPYAPAAKLGVVNAPRDIDGDGLMDLPANLEIVLGAGVECEGKSDWSAPKLLAHALADGTFSTTDAVAKSFTSSWCGSPPSKIASPDQALCARMWKQPRSVVSSSCALWDCALEAAKKPQPKNATRDCGDRLEAYDGTVPFTLP